MPEEPTICTAPLPTTCIHKRNPSNGVLIVCALHATCEQCCYAKPLTEVLTEG